MLMNSVRWFMRLLIALLLIVLALLMAILPVGARPLSDGSHNYTGGSLLSWTNYGDPSFPDCTTYWDGPNSSFTASYATCYPGSFAGIGGRFVWYIGGTDWDNLAGSITFTVTTGEDSCEGHPPALMVSVDPGQDFASLISGPSTDGSASVTWNNPDPGVDNILPMFLIVDVVNEACDSPIYFTSFNVSWTSASSPTATPAATATPLSTLTPWHFDLPDMVSPTLPALEEFAPLLLIVLAAIFAFGVLIWAIHAFRKAFL